MFLPSGDPQEHLGDRPGFLPVQFIAVDHQ
jgi:hypothetical protein